MPNYMDAAHRHEIERLSRTFTARTDWPTWLLILAFYAGWSAIVFAGYYIGTLLSIVLLIPLLVLWMSLQHECIHGHPTRSPGVNRLLVYLPFAVWYPYRLYKESHLAHHDDDALTLPGIDPESRYVDASSWREKTGIGRTLLWVNKSAFGRLVVGVPLALWSLLCDDIALSVKAGKWPLSMWAAHIFWVSALLVLVQLNSALSAAEYVMYVSLPALAIAMVRSLYEHRPAADPAHRTVLNESRGPFSWLFLNLNFHLVHHDVPGLPWYYLPRVYHSRRSDWINRSNGYVVRGYREMFAAHFFHPVDSPQHPGSD